MIKELDNNDIIIKESSLSSHLEKTREVEDHLAQLSRLDLRWGGGHLKLFEFFSQVLNKNRSLWINSFGEFNFDLKNVFLCLDQR